MPPTVLFVIPNRPYPLLSGAHLRDWQILHLLNRIGIVPHVLYFGTAEGGEMSSDAPLRTLAASVHWGGNRCERPDVSAAALMRRKLGYALRRHPTSHPFAYQYDAIGAGEIIARRAGEVGAAVVILRGFWSHYAAALSARGAAVIANCPDDNELLAWEMVRAVRNPVRRLGPLCNYLGVRRLERCWLPRCDEVWVPTPAEACSMGRRVAADRLAVVPNLLDAPSCPDLSGVPPVGRGLLFVANYEYLPNANAARRLLTAVFPAVRAGCPGAELHLVGRGLPARLRELAARVEGVRVSGFVDDLIPHYRCAAVVVLAVREGAGMLFKAVEALCLGKAVVGFREAFRGIAADSGAPFVVVDSNRELAQAALDLLRDPRARRALGARARAFAERTWSWAAAAEDLRRRSLLGRWADAGERRVVSRGSGIPAAACRRDDGAVQVRHQEGGR